MKKKFLTLLFILFSLCITAQIKMTGTVSDDTGVPLPGVTVIEKDVNSAHLNGTMTDLNGKFVLTTKKSQGELTFSFIGMTTKIIAFNGNMSIKVTMTSSDEGLDEVVVVGYGSQRKVSVVGAISSVSTKELLQSPASNLSNALVGRLSGLTTIQNTGQPGKDDASL